MWWPNSINSVFNIIVAEMSAVLETEEAKYKRESAILYKAQAQAQGLMDEQCGDPEEKGFDQTMQKTRRVSNQAERSETLLVTIKGMRGVR